MLQLFKKTKKNKQSGFTLPEMLISLAIVSVIMTVVLTNQSTYTDVASLANEADTVSLYLYQAQVYGVSTREVSPGTSNFSSSFGVNFLISGAGGADNEYLFFADKDNNGLYNGEWGCNVGASYECLEKIYLNNNNSIDSLCVVYYDDSEDCSLGGVSVTYKRPDTRAGIKFFNSSGIETVPTGFKGARIKLTSPEGVARAVSVYTTGYISNQ